MNRATIVLAACVVGIVMIVPAVGAVTESGDAIPDRGHSIGTHEPTADERTLSPTPTDTVSGATNTSRDVGNLTPGERLSVVVGVQGAEVRGEVDARSYESRLASAETERERATVVAAQVSRDEMRLAELRARQAALRDRRANGTLDPGTYAAQTARVRAEVATVTRTTERSATAAATLPAAAQTAAGVDPGRVDALREGVRELRGPEIAAIAREIAGNRTGAPMGAGPPAEPGPPNQTGSSTPGNDSPGNDPASGRPGTNDVGPPADSSTNGSEVDGASSPPDTERGAANSTPEESRSDDDPSTRDMPGDPSANERSSGTGEATNDDTNRANEPSQSTDGERSNGR